MRLSGQDLRAGMASDEVAELHVELARLGFTVPDPERQDKRFGVGTARAVATFQRAHGLPDSAVVDAATAAALTEAIAASESPRRITGRVYFDTGQPAGDITLRAYRRGFGGAADRLGPDHDSPGRQLPVRRSTPTARRSTSNCGPCRSTATRSARSRSPHRLRRRQGRGAQRRRPDVGAAARRRVPAAARRRRTDTCTGRRLGEAKETDEQPDLTLLQESTGWDARLVALAASAEQVAAETGVPPAAAYAMLRAGFPDDPVGLAGVSVVRRRPGTRRGGRRPAWSTSTKAERAARPGRLHLVRPHRAARRGAPGGTVEPGRDAGRRGAVRRRGRPIRRDLRRQRAAGRRRRRSCGGRSRPPGCRWTRCSSPASSATSR